MGPYIFIEWCVNSKKTIPPPPLAPQNICIDFQTKRNQIIYICNFSMGIGP